MNDFALFEWLEDVMEEEVFTSTELRPLMIESVEEALVEDVVAGIEVRPFTISPLVVVDEADRTEADDCDEDEVTESVDTGIVPTPETMTGVELASEVVDIETDSFLCCCAVSGPSIVVYPPMGPENVAEAVTKTMVILAGGVVLELVVTLVLELDALAEAEKIEKVKELSELGEIAEAVEVENAEEVAELEKILVDTEVCDADAVEALGV